MNRIFVIEKENISVKEVKKMIQDAYDMGYSDGYNAGSKYCYYPCYDWNYPYITCTDKTTTGVKTTKNDYSTTISTTTTSF